MTMAGNFVTEIFDYDGGRGVTVYVPSMPAEAIVYAGDGQMIAQWGKSLGNLDLPSTMIVGAHRLDDETLRLHEYSPIFDPERFSAHEQFFVDELTAWTKTRFDIALPRERTAVCGVSASGELSLALGLKHPDLYGAIFSSSPGAGYRPPETLPGKLPRTYLVAGTQEPFFLANAARWASALANVSADVIMKERDAGHDHTMWQNEFPLMLQWAFGK